MPQPSDYAPFFERYIALVNAPDVKSALDIHATSLNLFYAQLPDEKADYAYTADKWTLKDLLQHIIDTERIMAYRLLRIARNDSSPLASFDENNYASEAKAASRSFDAIKSEFIAVRNATDLLIQSLSPDQLAHKGIASNHAMSAEALVYIIFGHMLHHKKIIQERYL